MDISWVEPRKHWNQRQVSATDIGPAKLALCGVGIFVLFSLLRLIGAVNKPTNWPVFLPICFVGSMAFAFIWPQLMKILSASHVIISKKGINNNMQVGTLVRVTFWSWDKLGPVRAVDGTLVLTSPTGAEIVRLGISPKVSLQTVRSAVESSGGRWQP